MTARGIIRLVRLPIHVLRKTRSTELGMTYLVDGILELGHTSQKAGSVLEIICHLRYKRRLVVNC